MVPGIEPRSRSSRQTVFRQCGKQGVLIPAILVRPERSTGPELLVQIPDGVALGRRMEAEKAGFQSVVDRFRANLGKTLDQELGGLVRGGRSAHGQAPTIAVQPLKSEVRKIIRAAQQHICNEALKRAGAHREQWGQPQEDVEPFTVGELSACEGEEPSQGRVQLPDFSRRRGMQVVKPDIRAFGSPKKCTDLDRFLQDRQEAAPGLGRYRLAGILDFMLLPITPIEAKVAVSSDLSEASEQEGFEVLHGARRVLVSEPLHFIPARMWRSRSHSVQPPGERRVCEVELNRFAVKPLDSILLSPRNVCAEVAGGREPTRWRSWLTSCPGTRCRDAPSLSDLYV